VGRKLPSPIESGFFSDSEMIQIRGINA